MCFMVFVGFFHWWQSLRRNLALVLIYSPYWEVEKVRVLLAHGRVN
jgi:hypothetical protein